MRAPFPRQRRLPVRQGVARAPLDLARPWRLNVRLGLAIEAGEQICRKLDAQRADEISVDEPSAVGQNQRVSDEPNIDPRLLEVWMLLPDGAALRTFRPAAAPQISP